MLFTASTVFDTVTKFENTDYIIGNISTFNFPSAHPFLVGESVTGTGAYSTAAGVIYDATTTIAKVARTSTLDFSTTILTLSNGATTATYTSVSATYGIINDSIQRLYNRDAWLRENSAMLSENETVSGSWTFSGTVNSATITNLKSTTATITTAKVTTLDLGNTIITDGIIYSETNDGTDNRSVYVCGGGAGTVDRGALVIALGNEAAVDAGKLILTSGSVSGGEINLRTGNGQNRLTIDDGGISTFYGDVNIDGYQLTIGSSVSSNINMIDSDNGTRRIYCNDNRIGFLTQGGSWGSYCNDDGSWSSDVAVSSPLITATSCMSSPYFNASNGGFRHNGIEQWCTVTDLGAITKDVSYLNTNGKPMFLKVMMNDFDYPYIIIDISPDNSNWTMVERTSSHGSQEISGSTIIPTGWYFRITSNATIYKVIITL